MGPNRIAQLFADFHDWVERVHRTLRNQSDVGGARPSHLFLGQAQQVLSIQPNLSPFDHRRSLDQPHETQRSGRRTGTRLANESHPFADSQEETYAIYRAHGSAQGVIADLEVYHIEYPSGVCH